MVIPNPKAELKSDQRVLRYRPRLILDAAMDGCLTMRVFSNRHELFPQINFKKFVKKLEISGLTGRISGDPVDLR
jgi:hypothetical protein